MPDFFMQWSLVTDISVQMPVQMPMQISVQISMQMPMQDSCANVSAHGNPDIWCLERRMC